LKSVTHGKVVLLAVVAELDSIDAFVRQTAHLAGHKPSDGLVYLLGLCGIFGGRDEKFHEGILSSDMTVVRRCYFSRSQLCSS